MKPGDIVRATNKVLTPHTAWLLVTHFDRACAWGTVLTPFLDFAGRPKGLGDECCFNISASDVTVDSDAPEALAGVARLALEGRL